MTYEQALEITVTKTEALADYRVSYETREPGAIGIFEPRTFDVIASNPTEAGQLALDKVHEANLEGRFPLSVVKMTDLSRR